MLNTSFEPLRVMRSGSNQGRLAQGGGHGLSGRPAGMKAAAPHGPSGDSLDGDAIDHAYLGRFTQGNAALEREVLELFAGMMPRYLEDLKAARGNKAWKDAAHTIKGSAAAVGARRLARFAEMAERLDIETPKEQTEGYREEAVRALTAAVDEACRHIARRFAAA